MENFLTVVNGFAWLMGALGAAVAVFYVAHSGFLFITAQGDPQKSAQARGALIGVVIGLVVIGGAFLIPGTVSRFVIEPAGGVPVEPRSGFDCDGLLKEQLVFQRNASTPERMQFLVSRVQSQRSECAPEFWSPEVRSTVGHGRCYYHGGTPAYDVGGVEIPVGLEKSDVPVANSGRDADNNIIVYFEAPSSGSSTDVPPGLPSDGSVCWLYVSDFGAWTGNYYSVP